MVERVALDTLNCRAGLMTPRGVGGIAVVRVCGFRWREVLSEIFLPVSHSGKSLENNELRFGKICDGAEVIDQVIVSVDRDGGGVEINCHGGMRVVQRLLMLLGERGVEIVCWEDLFLGSSIEDEVSLVLPKVKTQMAVLAIAGQFPGGLYAWAQGVIGAIDGGGEREKLAEIRGDIDELLLTYPLVKKLLTPPTVVLAGPVNAGKSTLANALTGRVQSVANALPGTTRDWTGQLTEINGVAINLVDTAGRRDSDDPLERRSVNRADVKISEADLVVLVVEANGRYAEQIEKQMCTFPEGIEPIIVLNKCDKCSGYKGLAGSGDKDISDPLHYVSGSERVNLDWLCEAITGRLGFDEGFGVEQRLVFTERQYGVLQEVRAAQRWQGVLGSLRVLCDGK